MEKTVMGKIRFQVSNWTNKVGTVLPLLIRVQSCINGPDCFCHSLDTGLPTYYESSPSMSPQASTSAMKDWEAKYIVSALAYTGK